MPVRLQFQLNVPACHRSPSAEPRTEETVKNLCRPHPETRAKLRSGHGPDSRALKFEPWELRRSIFLSPHTICTSIRKVCRPLGHGCTQVWKRCKFPVQYFSPRHSQRTNLRLLALIGDTADYELAFVTTASKPAAVGGDTLGPLRGGSRRTAAGKQTTLIAVVGCCVKNGRRGRFLHTRASVGPRGSSWLCRMLGYDGNTVETMRQLIAVPPRIERVLLAFAQAHPEEAHSIEKSLKFRQAVAREFERLVREGISVSESRKRTRASGMLPKMVLLLLPHTFLHTRHSRIRSPEITWNLAPVNKLGRGIGPSGNRFVGKRESSLTWSSSTFSR